MDELLSCRVLFEAICLLPILAYPFLPSAGRSGVRCEVVLVWNALAIAAFLTANKFIGLGWQADLWAPILVSMYGSAGFQALRVPSSRAPEAKDFVSAADYIVVWIYLDYLDLFEAIFEGHPESVWMARVSRVSIEYLSVAVVVLAAFLFSRRFLSQALLHFITRRVSWWHWLPENGGAKEFGPFWSVFLAMAVVMAPLALFTAAIAGVH